ncbi:MAG: translation initiation factor IF-2 [Candidatus Omnitrophica bacterium]|nr:translation initiation factor IF-2 [Candidatus Omnitrophota bacterium]
MRIHELAKSLGMSSKDLIERIRSLGGDAKTHMSVVDEETLKFLQGRLTAPSSQKSAAKSDASDTSTMVQPPPAKKAKEEIKKTEAAQPIQSVEPASTAQTHTVEAIRIRFPVTVGHLATEFNTRIPDLIKALMTIGIFANVNQLLNEEIVFKVAKVLGIPVEKMEDELEKAVLVQEAEDPKKLKPRPPVVTLMGHVDHGKTSLLDAIRKTNVAAKEKGFITQHIGAYGVDIPGKGHVTFLDTPGHEAFTAMRARGANVTDVVVLVVAADDGVMPQTVEAINHAREAGCPIVVAINKSDLPQANPQKVMTGLQKLDLMPEEWGGKTICVKISAKTGQGIDQLLEMLLLEAEVLELKANPDRLATGAVIESHLSKGSGPVATIIVQQGTLRPGDLVVSGLHRGRVRSLRNDLGKNIKEAGPSYAAEVSGLDGVPEAGESFFVVADEKTAREITEKRILEKRERDVNGGQKHMSLEDLYHRISEGNFKELKLIIKADVQGSMEALSQSLEKLSNDKCNLHVIHAGMGGVNESDVMLAAASDAVIIGFHVKADPKAETIAEKEGVDIRFYHIIYEALEDVRKAMEGLLEPTYKEVVEGKIEIRKVFKSSKVGTIAGGMVIKGKVTRQNQVRLIRNHVVIFEGKLASLRRFKDDVREVAEGYECGAALSGFEDLHEGDIIESFRLDKIATKL